MRTISYSLVSVSLVLLLYSASCNKKEAHSKPSLGKLTGTWRYIGRSGGYAGLRFTPDSTQHQFLQLEDSTYIRLNQGKKQCGTWKIIAETKYAMVPGTYLAFDQKSKGLSIRFTHDTLVLTLPYADGMSHWYVKGDTTLSPCE